MRIANLTLHDQGELDVAAHSLEWAAKEPLGVEVEASESLDEIKWKVSLALDRAVQEGAEAILVGGHSAVIWALGLLLHPNVGEQRYAHLGVICFDTERIRDEAGRFVFNLRGVIVLRKASAIFGAVPKDADLAPGYMEQPRHFVPYISD